jgi:hypothetical protein
MVTSPLRPPIGPVGNELRLPIDPDGDQLRPPIGPVVDQLQPPTGLVGNELRPPIGPVFTQLQLRLILRQPVFCWSTYCKVNNLFSLPFPESITIQSYGWLAIRYCTRLADGQLYLRFK